MRGTAVCDEGGGAVSSSAVGAGPSGGSVDTPRVTAGGGAVQTVSWPGRSMSGAGCRDAVGLGLQRLVRLLAVLGQGRALERAEVLERVLVREATGHGLLISLGKLYGNGHAATASGSVVTWTSTSSVDFPGSPMMMPLTGAASCGRRLTATRIRSRDSARPLVGSNSVQPRSGRNTSTQAWVAPAPRMAPLLT